MWTSVKPYTLNVFRASFPPQNLFTERERERVAFCAEDDDSDDGQFARCFSALNEEDYFFLNRAAEEKAQKCCFLCERSLAD
jgi:hypothetical protein